MRHKDIFKFWFSIFILSLTFMTSSNADNVKASRKLLFSKDDKDRQAQLVLIQSSGNKNFLRDIEVLARTDPDQNIRSQAIGVLCSIGDSKSAHELKKIALSSPNAHDRRVAITGLVKNLEKNDAILTLAKGLDDPDQIVRIRAAGNLGKLGVNTGEAILISHSRNTDIAVKTEAVEAMGFVNTPAIKAQLQTLINESNPGSYAAKTSLRRIEYHEATPELTLTMAKEDLNSKNRNTIYLACEKLITLQSQEGLNILTLAANDPKNPAFRPARDIFLHYGFITQESYWDKKVTPSIKKK